MKLLLISVVISIHTTGFLTTAKVACKPLYHGGYGGAGGANVMPRWSFNPYSNHCEQVMVRSSCPPSQNCFPSKDECEENCDPETLAMLKELE
uniref:Putative salivary kunitz domain protein n=1 Tax=Ixodes ricinus TaxID=34613 RepID=A0A0K8RK89_IXORI